MCNRIQKFVDFLFLPTCVLMLSIFLSELNRQSNGYSHPRKILSSLLFRRHHLTSQSDRINEEKLKIGNLFRFFSLFLQNTKSKTTAVSTGSSSVKTVSTTQQAVTSVVSVVPSLTKTFTPSECCFHVKKKMIQVPCVSFYFCLILR